MANTQRTNNNRRERETLNDSGIKGIYLGEVISARDVSLTGRIKVFLPALGKDRNDGSALFDCLYGSPFAGSNNPRTVGENIPNPEDSLQSYGFWMVPPDVGSLVVVAFLDGDNRTPVIISCLFPDKFNFSVPGMPAGRTYASPNVPLPAVEKNRRVEGINHSDTTRPVHYEIAEAITRQGLIRDARRGPGNSSARRESPSQVFGLLTPGPKENNRSRYRAGGHQLIFDDNLDNRMVRIRTAKGQQLLFDDNAGTIYAINRDGEAWWELDAAGNFTVFCEGSINMRAKQDFNLRADKDINIEAGGDIKIKAAGDMASRAEGAEYVGPNTMGNEPAGYGGSIMMEAQRHFSSHSGLDSYHRSQSGSMYIDSLGDMHLTTAAHMHLLGDTSLRLTTNQNLGIAANGKLDVLTSDGTAIDGGIINLNSGVASPDTAEPAEQAPDIPTAEAEDQPRAKPEFQRNPEDALPGGGRRPGDVVRYTTIVGAFATAEPYGGHDHFDPTSEDIGTIDSDETLIQGLPSGSNGAQDRAGNFVRNDILTPNGTAIAVGPADSGGGAAAGVAGVADNAAAATGNAPGLGDLPKDMQQVSESPLGNFEPGQIKEVADNPVFDQLGDSLGSAIPSIAGQARDLAGQALTGIGKRLSEVEAQLSAVMVNAQGVVDDLTTGVGERIMNAVTTVRNSVGLEGFDPRSFLESSGIVAIQDGLSTIYQDSAGNQVIDIMGGAGPEAAKLMQTGELRKAGLAVKSRIVAPISDNQLGALASFAAHVGESNFDKSGIADLINSGNYADVPQRMRAFSIGIRERGGQPVEREDYAQRRMFEGELFSAPDGIELPVSSTRLTFEQLRQRLRGTKDEYFRGLSGK